MEKPKKTKKPKQKSKPLENLKVEYLCLYQKFFNKNLNLYVEGWRGETEDKYFAVDIAVTADQKACSSIGSINERESKVFEDREILLSKDYSFDIFDLAKYLNWNLENATIEEMLDIENEY